MNDHDVDRDPRDAEPVPAGPVPRVKLDVFEGPLDLLLHLIKKNEVEVADIPIATITAQYLEYVDLMRHLNLDVAGEFLVMAATLMLIKSRMLLPDDSAAEEEDEEDPRADLVRQLLEYQRYRDAAAVLADRSQLHRDVFAREPVWDGEAPVSVEPGLLRASMWELLDAYRRVLERARPASVHEVMLERVSLRDRVRLVLARLGAAGRLDFESLFPETATRLELIVTFLAVLELVRLRAIRAYQMNRFGPIVLSLVVDDPDSVVVDLLDEYGHEAVREER